MFYNILLLLLFPFFMAWRSAQKAKSKYLYKYLSKSSSLSFQASQASQTVWLHAASLGEAKMALCLVDDLQNELRDDGSAGIARVSTKNQNLSFVITTNTLTALDYLTKQTTKQSDKAASSPDGDTTNNLTAKQSDSHAANPNKIHCCLAPYDLPFIVRSFLAKHQPSILVLMEAELWRNWLIVCRDKKIPVFLANARLSPASLHKRLRMPFIHPPVNAMPQTIAAQSADDANNLRTLYRSLAGKDKYSKHSNDSNARNEENTDPPKIKVCGTIKFDLSNSPAKSAELSPSAQNLIDNLKTTLKQQPKIFIWCGASTSHPEEKMLIMTQQAIKQVMKDSSKPDNEPAAAGAIDSTAEDTSKPQSKPQSKSNNKDTTLPDCSSILLLAPRHPQRFDRIRRMLSKLQDRHQLNYIALSQLSKERDLSSYDILLIDTIGDLPHIFPSVNCAFVGGSFTKRGGQNILEPLSHNVPVILGPRHHNLTSIMQAFLEDEEASTYISIVTDQQQLTEKLLGLAAANLAMPEISGIHNRSIDHRTTHNKPTDNKPSKRSNAKPSPPSSAKRIIQSQAGSARLQAKMIQRLLYL